MTNEELGFNYRAAGAHTSRSLMTADLSVLLNYVSEPSAAFEQYNQAIVDENCLGKGSLKNRILTARHLKHLYALDAQYPTWTALRFLYKKDTNSLRLLALLCAFGRDELLRVYFPFLLSKEHGVTIPREETEAFFDQTFPGRFSLAMLKSLAQNINGSYTLSGHLKGRAKKVRNKPKATTAAVVYAVYLGALLEKRGIEMLNTDFVKILELNEGEALEHLQIASQRGWVNLKHMGEVIEINFPHFTNQQTN